MFVSAFVLIFLGVLIVAVTIDIVVTLVVSARMSRENRLLAAAFTENETKNESGEQNRSEDA